MQQFPAWSSTLTGKELVYTDGGKQPGQRLCSRCSDMWGCVQGGAEWALARRDQLALGLSEIPQAARQRETTPAGRARAALALTTLPKHLPCRDAERAQIDQFLEDVLCPGANRDTSFHSECMPATLPPCHLSPMLQPRTHVVSDRSTAFQSLLVRSEAPLAQATSLWESACTSRGCLAPARRRR